MLEGLKEKVNGTGQDQAIGKLGEELKVELDKFRVTLERVKEQLLDKVDVEDFEDIVNQLKNMLAQQPGGNVQV